MVMTAFSSARSRRLFYLLGFAFLNILLLPIDSYFLLCSYVLQLLQVSRQLGIRNIGRRQASSRRRVVLISGLESSKGIFLARTFHLAGHTVIGASIGGQTFSSCGHFSDSIKKHYILTAPDAFKSAAAYIRDLETVIDKERVDIWITASDVSSLTYDVQAAEVIRRRTSCVAFNFDTATADKFNNLGNLTTHLRSIGLPTLETYNVTSRASVHKILDGASKHGKKYVIKAPDSDDRAKRKDTILPRRTLSQTYSHVSQIKISASKPWTLQEFVGEASYCTQSLVIHGEVVAFAAWQITSDMVSFQPLPIGSPLRRSMLIFTNELLSRGNSKSSGHLSLEFRVQPRSTEKGLEQLLYPISGSTGLQDAIVMYQGLEKKLAAAYLTILESSNPKATVQTNGAKTDIHTHVLEPLQAMACNWLVYDMVDLFLVPMLQLVAQRVTLEIMLTNWKTFLRRLVLWKSPFYEVFDPLPWWIRYHVHLPLSIAKSIISGGPLPDDIQRNKWSM